MIWFHTLFLLFTLNTATSCLTCSYLLEQDFPGMRIGPEPTTDSFIAVMHGDIEGVIPGNALVVDPKKPFRKLNAFGNAFLNRYELRTARKASAPAGTSGWHSFGGVFRGDEMSHRGERCANTGGGTEAKKRLSENRHRRSTFLRD